MDGQSPLHLVALVVVSTPTTAMDSPMDMVDRSPSDQQGGIFVPNTLAADNRNNVVSDMLHLDQEVISQRILYFVVYEQGLLEFLSQSIPTPVPSPPPQVVVTHETSRKIEVKSFHENEGDNLAFSQRETDFTFAVAQIRDDRSQVAPHLDGHA
ncbi:uncharacterized protein PHALS_06552 [Plasmopara halstedii]|uniref:RxLR-like protein n=1 Tax=Plasmopara halstedii TaxID=4781 RepID=A0A0P1B1X0_PLAHL|nr:uncharacterized protein PHALS_06552 [Plasmopara halstedii]CEG48746.1 hypothetical protein PHALS_06552 [Plasmopara halstedii]|eukprot:XP_024585115.1 hypothetical protein PHALS_06552 [Plasmopara halstedii]